MAIFASSFLFSCQQTSNKKSEEKIERSSVDSLQQSEAHKLEMKVLADSLDMVYSKYADLLKDKKGGDYRNQIFYRKVHIQQSEIDSLKSVINVLQEKKIENIENPPKVTEVLSQDERELRKMIHSLNSSWVRMHKTKKAKEVLQYFNSNFLASWIMVEKDNSANAAFYTQNDFGNFLRDIIRNKGITYEFGNVKFFEVEIKNHHYFNVAYKCERRAYKDDVLQHKESVLVTIAGKKVKKDWKIASYAWIGFKYSNTSSVENSN
jgi:hypothetical protein